LLEHIVRERPLRERKPKKTLELDPGLRQQAAAVFPPPTGAIEFKEGYIECIDLFALHSPNKRQVGRILDEHCITLENACIASPTKENYARYGGYRQAMKDLERERRIRLPKA
jgi:hypothetical protein